MKRRRRGRFKTRAIDGEGSGDGVEAHDAPEEAFAARALASKLDGFLEHVLRRAWRRRGRRRGRVRRRAGGGGAERADDVTTDVVNVATEVQTFRTRYDAR